MLRKEVDIIYQYNDISVTDIKEMKYRDGRVKMKQVHIPSTEFGSQFVEERKTTPTTASAVTNRRDIIGIRWYSKCTSSPRNCVCSPILRRATRYCCPVCNASFEIHVVTSTDGLRRWGKCRCAHPGCILFRRTAYKTATLIVTTTTTHKNKQKA